MSLGVRLIPGTSGFKRATPPWWKRFGVSCYHDWDSFLFWRVNWSDFTFIELSAEIEWHMENAEIGFALLGVHVRATYYWPGPGMEGLKRTARLVEAGMLDTVPLESLETPEQDAGRANC